MFVAIQVLLTVWASGWVLTPGASVLGSEVSPSGVVGSVVRDITSATRVAPIPCTQALGQKTILSVWVLLLADSTFVTAMLKASILSALVVIFLHTTGPNNSPSVLPRSPFETSRRKFAGLGVPDRRGLKTVFQDVEQSDRQ